MRNELLQQNRTPGAVPGAAGDGWKHTRGLCWDRPCYPLIVCEDNKTANYRDLMVARTESSSQGGCGMILFFGTFDASNRVSRAIISDWRGLCKSVTAGGEHLTRCGGRAELMDSLISARNESNG